MSKIFISYRRNTNEVYARELYKKLASKFGNDEVFIADSTLATNNTNLYDCKVMLVLIDPYEIDIEAENTQHIHYFDKKSSAEIGIALQHNIDVIPVLLDGAVLPKAENLSQNILSLSEKISCCVNHGIHYADDIENLINLVSEYQQNKLNGRFQKLDHKGTRLADCNEDWNAVLDQQTQLVWEIKRNDGSTHDKEQLFTWQEGHDYIKQANQEKLGNHSDWRMPTLEELKTLVDSSQDDDWKIDHHYFNDQPSLRSQ